MIIKVCVLIAFNFFRHASSLPIEDVFVNNNRQITISDPINIKILQTGDWIRLEREYYKDIIAYQSDVVGAIHCKNRSIDE